MKRLTLILSLALLSLLPATAQIGNYRQDLAIGVNGGYALTNFRFTPKVTQGMHGGLTPIKCSNSSYSFNTNSL